MTTTTTPQINVKQSISEVFWLCLRRVNHGMTSQVLLETPRELNFPLGLVKCFIFSSSKEKNNREEFTPVKGGNGRNEIYEFIYFCQATIGKTHSDPFWLL